MKLIFFDLETTGTNPARNGIHQIREKLGIYPKKVVLYLCVTGRMYLTCCFTTVNTRNFTLP